MDVYIPNEWLRNPNNQQEIQDIFHNLLISTSLEDQLYEKQQVCDLLDRLGEDIIFTNFECKIEKFGRFLL